MATNTLGEFSDGEDDFVFEIDENLWSDPEADDLIRNINEEEILARVYGNDDDVIRNIDEDEVLAGEWSDPEADDLIRNINEEEILARVYGNDDDDVIRNIDEDEVLARVYGNDIDEDEVQIGRGEKRKSEDEQDDEQGQYYYHIESRKKYHSKKFGMTATDHRVRFNNVLADFDLLESYESTLKIFHHLLEEVTEGMAPNDKVRFILRSDQLETPISLPFLTVEQLNTERFFSQIERVIQSNQEFRLNDTVTIDINHVKTPQGRGRSKRTTLNIRDHLKEKKSIIRINNKDDFCLARALAVSIARIQNDPKYNQIIRADRYYIQLERALDLHVAANVPLGPCGIEEVKLFQNYLSDYQIIIVSGTHNNSIIYPPKPPGTDEKPTINLYFHDNHFDVITKLPGFLSKSYFCKRCHKCYNSTTDHMCPAMCRSCRGFGCVLEGEGIVCNECNRLFNNQACHDHHKEPVNGGGRSVCEAVRKYEKCGNAMDARKIKDGGHICGKKCRTCGLILSQEDNDHKCYMQQLEQEEESSYNQLLFFDFEATQEHGTHCPNLCVVHDEEREVALFQGKDTVKNFCQWLFTPEHKGCIVVAHNFQGYDGYFINEFLKKLN